MKLLNKILMFFILTSLAIIIMPMINPQMQSKVQASTIKLSKTKKTIYEGNTYKLKIQGTDKIVKWSSSNTKVAKVNSEGKVTAKKNGTAIIRAKVGKKEIKCKIKVKLPQYDEYFYDINKYALKRVKLTKIKKSKIIKYDLDGDKKKDTIKIQLTNDFEYLKSHKISINGKKFIEGIYTELYIVDINKKDKSKEIIIKDAEATDGPGFLVYAKKGNTMKKIGGIGVTSNIRLNGKGKILSDGDELSRVSPRIYTKYYNLSNSKINEKISTAEKIKNIKFKSEYIQTITDSSVLKDIYPQDFAEMFMKYSKIDENGNEVEDTELNQKNQKQQEELGVQELENIKFYITGFGKLEDFDTIKIKGINQDYEGFALNYFAI